MSLVKKIDQLSICALYVISLSASTSAIAISDMVESSGEQIVAPVALTKPKPHYPSESLRLKETGVVQLSVLVNVHGDVADILVDQSSKYKRLDEEALATVKQWKFSPMMVDGVASEGWTTIPITFVIDTPPVIIKQQYKEHWTTDQNGCQLFDYNLQRFAKYQWSGECKDGYIDGIGVVDVIYDDVIISSMKGTYQKGMLNGLASMVTPYSSEYQGEFVNGLKSGIGKQRWKHGLQYEGNFVNNERTGHGVLSWPNGVRYEGEFIKGEPVQNVMAPPNFHSHQS